MHRKFITLIVAAAIAVTGFSGPARAGNKDFARALAGLAALAIIGAAIHDSQDRSHARDRNRDRPREPERGVRRNHGPVVSRNHTPPVYRGPEGHRHGYVAPRPLPNPVARNFLPRSCIRRVNTQFGDTVRMLGRRCLNNSYSFVGRLPRHCAQRVWTPNGERRGFNVHCLKQNGYRISRN